MCEAIPMMTITQQLLDAADRGRHGRATQADVQLLNAYLRAGGSLRELGGATLLSDRLDPPVSAAVMGQGVVGTMVCGLTSEQLALCEQLGIEPAAFAAQQAKMRAAGKVV